MVYVKMKKRRLIGLGTLLFIISSYFVWSQIIADKTILSINDNFGVEVDKISEKSDGVFRIVTYKYGNLTTEIKFQESELTNTKLMNNWLANHNNITMIDWYSYKWIRNVVLTTNVLDFNLTNDALFLNLTGKWSNVITKTPENELIEI